MFELPSPTSTVVYSILIDK